MLKSIGLQLGFRTDPLKYDSYPPELNEVNFELSTSQTGKDTLYTTDKKDFEIRGILLINKADYKRICYVNISNKQQSKIEAGGGTFGEMKYANGEVSLLRFITGELSKEYPQRHIKRHTLLLTQARSRQIWK